VVDVVVGGGVERSRASERAGAGRTANTVPDAASWTPISAPSARTVQGSRPPPMDLRG
jgi:hypothetical protein